MIPRFKKHPASQFLGWAASLFWLSLVSGHAGAAPLSDETQDGIHHYNHEEYAKARQNFEAARQADPENPQAAYNLANTYYRLGHYDHAIQAFNEAEARFQDPGMKQKAIYNKGNALFRTGDADGAIAAYKKALSLDPHDIDAKYNLEYVRMLQQRAQQANRVQPKDMRQRQEPRTGGLNPARQDQPGGKAPSDSDQKTDAPREHPSDSQQADKEPPQSQDPESQEDPRGDPQAPSVPSAETRDEPAQTKQALQDITAMSKQEADRWLHSLEENLKKFSRRQLQGQMKDLFVEGDKDW